MAPSTPKTACLYTLGCRLNQAETALMSERLEQAGFRLVPFGEPADAVVINTCTVTAEADAKSRKAIRSYIRKHPDVFVAVVGCYAQLQAQEVARTPGVDVVLGNREKLRVADYIGPRKNPRPVVVSGELSGDDFSIEMAGASPVSRRASLKIQEGCDFRCSYCVVPLARGGPRSRVFGNLLEEAEALVARGAREVVLTGVNVGLYRQGDRSLLDVVDGLNAVPGLARIRISSIEFTTVPEGLLERMDDPAHALVPFLHIPLQSGSDPVLRAMNRHYEAGEFVRFAERAAAAVGDLCLGTDLLVGFPGETLEDHLRSCAILETSPLAYAHVFTYSPRKGTVAETLGTRPDPVTAARRSAELRRISRVKRETFLDRLVGRTLDVLFESRADGRWHGYTGNYARVGVCSDDDLENVVRPVLLEQNRGDSLEGRLAG